MLVKFEPRQGRKQLRILGDKDPVTSGFLEDPFRDFIAPLRDHHRNIPTAVLKGDRVLFSHIESQAVRSRPDERGFSTGSAISGLTPSSTLNARS